ncbi:MAG: hypothetical protein IPK59_08390 [Rhodospirillaceae bacterium]|nr:hypothetical protein [Rhodospirillaceae bacterium]
MMKRLVAILFLIGSGDVAWADCNYAINDYNDAISEISYAMKRYTNCVSNSEGQDDCSSEFRKLKYAQDEFESAVSAISYECD